MAVALDQNLYVLSPYGPVQPTTLQGPIRQGLGKYGDGLFVEEGTTNVATNPWPTTAWGSANTTAMVSSGGPIAGKGYQKVTTLGTDSNVAAATVTLGATGLWTGTVYVYLESGNFATTGWAFGIEGGTATVGSQTINPSATVVAAGQWVRLRSTWNVTGTGTAVLVVRDPSQTVVGGVIRVACMQMENKAYPTSFAAGDLATDWNAPGAAYTQGFEDGTTGGFTVAGGTATLANSTTAPHAAGGGTKNLRASVTATAALSVRGPSGTAATPVTPGKWFTGSQWVRPSAARQLRADIFWYKADGSSSASPFSTGTAVTGVANTYTRQSISGIVPSDAAFATVQFNSSDATNADTFDIDDLRISEGTDAAAYRWTGAENASTSTRTAATLNEPLASNLTPSTITLAAVIRVSTSMAAAAVAGFPVPIDVNDGTVNNRLLLVFSGSNLTVQKVVGGVSTTSALSIGAPAAGDLIFVAGTFDSTNLVIYASKNGAAVTSNSSATTTVPAALTTANIGQNLQGNWLDAIVEQVLVYNRALTSTEVNALAAASSETAYASDPGIVLAAGTGVVRGTIQASTSAGTGYYRADRSMKCYVETLTRSGSNPDDDTATVKISVPAGSGIGVGQMVAVNYPMAAYGLTVQRVFSPGGDYDEVYAA
jgi:hypothetical protein